MVVFLSFTWGCLSVGIPESYIFCICWLIGYVIVYVVGSVKIHLWVVDLFYLSLFCPPFRFISFPSSKLAQVLFLPLILFYVKKNWGGCEDIRNFFWIKWDTICLQRENGGLEVKRLREFNISLLGKWVWRLLEGRESLQNVVLHAKYGEEGEGAVWQG